MKKKELNNKRKNFYFETPGKKKTPCDEIVIKPIGERMETEEGQVS
jgi:hypothetical protein